MHDASALANRIDGLSQGRVLVLGDVMLDRYVYGSVDRVSPEAPIPIVLTEREEPMLGGAGNVARNLAALGASTTLVGVTGDDGAGEEVQALLAAEPRARSRLVTEPGRRTTVKTRYIAAGQQLFRADRESVEPIASVTARRVLAAVDEALPEHHVLVLSDYAKGVLGDAVLATVVARAREGGKPVIADPKIADFGRYSGVSLLTPNRAELAAATGRACTSDAEVFGAAKEVIERHGIGAVLVTLSERGMALVTAEGEATRLEAEAREVFDVSGAGDTVVATLASALAVGLPLAAAAQLANLAGGIAVGKLGTAVVHPAELAAALHARDMRSADVKICTLEMAAERIAQWRRRGARVGFTNGCFDLIHPGHVALLSQAKAACDRLVVGLNSDASVRRLKGERRPIQNEAARAAVLASLATVDAVVVFAEDTPIEVIEALRPEVLVKGADYTLEQVVGADLVQGYGGKVLLAELEPGHSTSGTIAKLVG